jgi:nucleoprotein TPR
VDSSTTEGTSGDADVGGDVDTKVSELRSVVAYLRKEKEIVDLQLELSKQENVRLKAQIEHLTQSLQETRATLAEERERAMEAATSDAQHAEMLERINQFNIVRESNATLRAECETYAKRSRELDAKLQALSTELEPVKEQARVAQAELQARDAQITRLEGESRRWQERNAQLLSKYDRTDPAEIQTLKDEIETLKTQKANVEKLAAEHEERANTIQARLSRLEANFRMHKESNKSSVEKFKSNLGLLNSEKSQLNATISELEGKVKTLTAERDALRTTSAPDASQQLNSQLETLRQEKVTLEQALANERAAKFRAPAEASPDQAAVIASLREERDRLLAEKEALNKVGSSTLPSDAARLWESEKLELIKARDEALARATTADDLAKKASDDVRNLRQSNEKFQARAQEMHKAREKFNSEQAALVAAAVEKAKNEITAGGASVNTEELSKKHTQELEALRAQLTAEHEAALKAAVDAATKAAKTETATSPSDESTKAAIAAAIAAHDAELQERHSAELDAAVERGRLESQAKSKIKDGQLVRSQVKLKDLEAQVLEWRKAGLIPEAPPPQTPTASTSKMPPPVTPTASTSQSATASTQVAPAPSTTAVKPAAAAPAGQPAAASGEKPPTSGAVPLGVLRGGRGRIAPRGTGRGTSTRGAAPGRGGAPPPAPATSGTTGISIIGAASKRSREEDLPADDSLAKRLKPAAETTIASKPPVTLRRPPPS